MSKVLRKIRAKSNRIFIYLVLIAASLICVIPFLWMVSTSFKSMREIFMVPPTLIPKRPTLSNYPKGWGYSDFTTYTKNTVLLAATATVGTVFSSAFVGYGFARFKSRLSGLLTVVLLGTIMLPPQVTIVPQYMLFHKFGMIDTYWPIIIPAWLGGGAFNIFLFIQFFRTIPKELDEAAEIDGASSLQIFTRIMLPTVKPVILAVTVMSLVYHWNDFFTPLIYLSTTSKYTIAVGLQFFQSAYGNIQIGQMMAVSLVTLLPVLITFFTFQRYFIQGIKMSGLKS